MVEEVFEERGGRGWLKYVFVAGLLALVLFFAIGYMLAPHEELVEKRVGGTYRGLLRGECDCQLTEPASTPYSGGIKGFFSGTLRDENNQTTTGNLTITGGNFSGSLVGNLTGTTFRGYVDGEAHIQYEGTVLSKEKKGWEVPAWFLAALTLIVSLIVLNFLGVLDKIILIVQGTLRGRPIKKTEAEVLVDLEKHLLAPPYGIVYGGLRDVFRDPPENARRLVIWFYGGGQLYRVEYGCERFTMPVPLDEEYYEREKEIVFKRALAKATAEELSEGLQVEEYLKAVKEKKKNLD